MSYQQDRDLNASAHNISIACHCSQDKRHMPLRVCQGLWQLLTHLSCHPYPPISTRPYALIHRQFEILERCHTLLCLSGFSHSVLSETPLLAPSPPLPPLTSLSQGILTHSSRLSLWVMSLAKTFLTLHTLSRKSWIFPSYHFCACCLPLNTYLLPF